MKRYKLLKDLPTVKAGATFREIVREVDGSRVLKEYETTNKVSILVSEINNFDNWFEEIQEPTDSIYWKPRIGDKCFILENNNIRHTNYTGMVRDYNAYITGRVFRFEKEAITAVYRELAEARLRRTSTFKPDFKNGNGGWVVMYDHFERVLAIECCSFCDSGEPVRYETEEEALKSIKENEKDWLIYFGIKEGE